jgi:hypothetical protein
MPWHVPIENQLIYDMKKMHNLLLVAGTGRNSGKTTMVCRVTQQFRHLGIISVKISPHFHEPSKGLLLVSKNQGYIIYEETNHGTSKDTSRMLQCGAKRVLYAQVHEGFLNEAFSEIIKNIPENGPVVCESPSLIRHVRPGVFVIMISDNEVDAKNIAEMRLLPHSEYNLKMLLETEVLPFNFSNGMWTYE